VRLAGLRADFVNTLGTEAVGPWSLRAVRSGGRIAGRGREQRGPRSAPAPGVERRPEPPRSRWATGSGLSVSSKASGQGVPAVLGGSSLAWGLHLLVLLARPENPGHPGTTGADGLGPMVPGQGNPAPRDAW